MLSRRAFPSVSEIGMTHDSSTSISPSSPTWFHRRSIRQEQSPHVLHVVPTLFGPSGIVGGAERYAYELARHMARVTPTTLLTFGSQRDLYYEQSLRVVIVDQAWHIRGNRHNPFALEAVRRLAEADIVHCHQRYIVMSSIAALFCRLSGRKVVVTDLGGGGWDFSSYISTDRWFHAHLHISQYSRRHTGHADKPFAHVIYGGVDTDRFCPAAEPTPRNLSAVFVGRLLAHKGINYLMDAIIPPLSAEIIGQKMDNRYYQELLNRIGNKSVRLRHDCQDRDIIDAYRRANCVVLPSVYEDMYGNRSEVPELLGQTLIEGMACGTPAICSAVASMPEVVRHGETGFVVPPNDPHTLRERIAWLAAHPEHVEQMGRAARAWVLERFVWSKVVEHCLSIYRSL